MKKIYSINKEIVERFAKDENKELDFIKENVGVGYCVSGNYIRVFVNVSHVDTSDKFQDVTSKYISHRNNFIL